MPHSFANALFDRHELKADERDELRRRLASRSPDELRELLALLAERLPRATRLIRLTTLDSGETPPVDTDRLRDELAEC
ncbi:MAG: hypothetical protein ACOCV2_15540, partial [Persicimonas sp.]